LKDEEKKEDKRWPLLLAVLIIILLLALLMAAYAAYAAHNDRCTCTIVDSPLGAPYAEEAADSVSPAPAAVLSAPSAPCGHGYCADYYAQTGYCAYQSHGCGGCGPSPSG
jgi:hypothetical protein